MQRDILKSFMSKNDIMYLVLVDIKDATLEEFGDKEKLSYDGILKSYFYDMETIYRLNSLLSNELIPKVFRQGELACCVSKPNPSTIIGMFYNESRDAVESYKWSKFINQELLEIL